MRLLVLNLFIYISFSSCIYLKGYKNADTNKTKIIINGSAFTPSDTLYIATPFTKTYYSVNSERYWSFVDFYQRFLNNYPIPLQGYIPFPQVKNEVNSLAMKSYDSYLNFFKNKKAIHFSSKDSIIIFEQIKKINLKLRDTLITDLTIPDTLYNYLMKYGNGQFLLTDILEHYTPIYTTSRSNTIFYNHYFIIDIPSKQLSFYNYLICDDYMNPASLNGVLEGRYTHTYTFYRQLFIKKNIKKYNRKIRHSYRSYLRDKK